MNQLSIIFLAILGLFIFLLFIKEITKLRFCVICVSISSTWLILLLLYWFGYFDNMLLVAILMGESSLGVYYLLEKRVKEKFHLFRLPFLFLLVYIVYSLINLSIEIQTLLTLLIIWVLFFIIFMYKTNPKIKKVTNKIIECCKDW